jgi:hypothetical protein
MSESGVNGAAPGAGGIPGHRLPVVVVLVGLVVAAAAVGDGRANADAGVREPALAASIPAAGVRSSAWYCAGGPVGIGPSGDRVTISNVGSRAVPVAVDVMVAGSPVAERLVTVTARSSKTLSVAQLSRAPAAAVVVQPLGEGVVVQQGYSTAGDVAMAPCATRASSSWYFAAGSSVGGAQQWLSVFDPFGIDAVVDVEAYTESGFRSPGSLQGLIVRQGSRISVRVDRAVAEQKNVAVAVHARNGALIVAAQSLVRPLPGNRTSVSLSLGGPAPARTWMFAENRSRANAVQQLVLANPGDTDATARVFVVPDVAAVIEPRVVPVPATSAVAVDFSGVVPAGVAYTLVVRSAVPVVAESRDLFANASGSLPGLVTEVGSTTAARRWAFAGGPFTATGLGGAAPRVPDGFDLTVLMAVKATAHQIGVVRAALKFDGHVRRFHMVTREEALSTFAGIERDNPALLQSVTKDMLPVSFNVVVKNQASVAVVTRRDRTRAGVDRILTADVLRPTVVDDVVVLNPGSHAVRVSVVTTAGGATLTGQGMSNVLVAPGRQVTISLLALVRTGAAAVVSASGPVVAERFTGGPWGVTRAPGVPG